MMKQNQSLRRSQKQGKNFRLYLAGYLDIVAKGLILLFFIGVPLYYVIVSWVGLSFWIFFLLYTLCIFLLSPVLKKFTFGNFFLEYFEKWGKKIEKKI